MLVANKIDQYGDRMVLVEDGQRRYREIGCVGFREISVRESIEQVRLHNNNPYISVFTYMQRNVLFIMATRETFDSLACRNQKPQKKTRPNKWRKCNFVIKSCIQIYSIAIVIGINKFEITKLPQFS